MLLQLTELDANASFSLQPMRRSLIWCVDVLVGNANPGGIFQTRVYGFDGLKTRVPGFTGLTMSVRRAAGSYCRVGLQLVVCLVFIHRTLFATKW